MQDKGSARIIVSVVATKDLRSGDVLLRFSGQGDPHGGTNSNRYSRSSSALC